MPRNSVYRQRAALCAKDRLLRCVPAVHRWFGVHMIFQEEFPRNKGKPDELFGGCAAAAVISLFLGSVSFFADAKKKKNTRSQQPVGLYYPLFLTVLLPSHHLESCCFFPGWWTVNTVWSLFCFPPHCQSLSISSLSIISQSSLSPYFWSGVRSTTTKKKLKKIPIFANYRLKLSWGLCTKDLLFMPCQHRFYNNCNDQEGQKLFKTTSCFSWKNSIRQNETFPPTWIRLGPNWSHRRWRAAAPAAATCSWCCWRLTAAGPLFRSTCTVCRKSFFESAEPSQPVGQSAGWLDGWRRHAERGTFSCFSLNN